MKILLYELGSDLATLVLWDGKNTYWGEGQPPSSGYDDLELGKINPVTNGRFTLIGEL